MKKVTALYVCVKCHKFGADTVVGKNLHERGCNGKATKGKSFKISKWRERISEEELPYISVYSENEEDRAITIDARVQSARDLLQSKSWR